MNLLRRIRLGQYRLRQWIAYVFVYPQKTIADTLSYDDYWDDKRPEEHTNELAPAEASRARIIASRLEQGTVGDIGSGPGVVLKAIMNQRPGLRGIVFDSSQRALDDANKIGIEGHLLDITAPGALAAVPPCDYYIALEVLEHVPNSEEVLRALVTKCTKKVLLSVPNTGFFRHRLRLLLGRAPAQWVTMPNEHLRFWTIRDMRWWLTALGYTKFEIIPYHGVPGLNTLMPNLFAEGMIVEVSHP